MASHRNSNYVWTDVGWVRKNIKDARDYSDQNPESWQFLISVFRWYPDILLDILRADDADYPNEELIQRVMMRANARYRNVFITGCRSLTKTNSLMKERLVHGIVYPGISSAYYGPAYKQMAEIGSATYRAIEKSYPALTEHYAVKREGQDTFELHTKKNTKFLITVPRGANRSDVSAEEVAQEEAPAFDWDEFSSIVAPTVRLRYMVDGMADPTYVPFQKHFITSAGRKQNQAYEMRQSIMRDAHDGGNAFAMDVPWQVIVLSQMRPYDWVVDLRKSLTPDKWLREMESRYTGADANPLVRDEVLTESRCLQCMEDRHCGDPKVIYIVAYDVSYEDNKKNAKCGLVVVKLTEQRDFIKRDKYLKQVVYAELIPPAPTSTLQAMHVKDIWHRFCLDGGEATYLVIDGWQYGKSVVEELMKDMNDGLPPLCIFDHRDYTNIELDGALPVIYNVKAGGVGVTDNEAEMMRYFELQFEQRNVQLLTANLYGGIEAYKKKHFIKDDYADASISRPYRFTTEIVGQLQNLRKIPSGATMKIQRISRSIQKDGYSAMEYAFRMAQILELRKYQQSTRKKTDWDKELAKWEIMAQNASSGAMRARVHSQRMGGKRF